MLNGKEQRDRGGRRPLLATFAGNNRQMLIDIRDSLSHLRKNPSAQTSGTPEQNKPEQAQGASNHTDRTAAGAGALGSKMGRFGYNKQALAQIRADLSCYKHEDSTSLNGLTLESAQEEVVKKQIKDLVAHGYDEDLASKALKLAGPRGVEGAIEIIQQLQEHLDRNGLNKTSKHSGLSGYNKVTRKPSFDEKYRQGSPVSVSDSIRSSSPNVGSMQSRLHGDSPRHSQPSTAASTPTGSANTSTDGRLSPPPPLPPRSRPLPPSPPQSSDPPPPIPPKGELKLLHQPQGPPGHVQQMIRRMSNPAINHQDLRPHTSSQSSTSSGPVTAQRAVGPISKMVSTPPQSLPVMSHQLSTLTLQPGVDGIVPVNTMKPPPPYTQSPQARHSPTVIQSSGYNDQMMMDYRAPPLYDTSTHSSGSSSPASMGQSPVFPGGTLSKPPTPLPPKPEAMRAWGAKQPPIIMQSVKSREVQKPILQTATVPVSPQIATPVTSPPSYTSSVQAQVNSAMHVQYPSNGVASLCMPVQPSLSPAEGVNCLPLPPRSNVHIEIRRNQQQHSARTLPVDQRPSIQVHIQNNGMNSAGYMPGGYLMDVQTHQPLLRKMSPDISTPTTSRSDSPVSRATNQSPISMISTISTPSSNSDIPDKPPPPYLGEHIKMPEKHRCTSPIPERRPEAKEKDEERRETFVRNYSPQAFKFYMEQHVENVLKSYKQRVDRRVQLEREMAKVGLPEEAQCQMRRMLHQKESNYIRLKRAKMDKAMFEKIKDLGIGAFGEVALVRKKDSKKLFAMKTLRKRDVLLRNQVAHVKAERDILAEADNEWVVKLYFSFQDRDSLYFIMDYIPGGDMMSLLIKFGIFQEELAQFYIAELVLAIESVHKMGFIHRDIKPDNILIDKDGHIKLTDFGLCTGFRWTHNSKYYQKDGHCRQDSMDIDTAIGLECDCTELLEKRPLKPLERRKRREQHQRCLAHSLVGTPNYIAPEVLLRSGYTASCDWWSVGVILYEMLVGQPPFLAKTPAETQYKVINWNSSLRIPREANLTGEAEDLILKFICDASHRLGSNQAGEIKTHPFFKTIQFEGLRHREAMYKPQIKYATDTSNFDPVEPDRLRSDSEDCDSKLDVFGENGKHQEHAFFEFTFRRFFDDGGHALASAAALAASSANAAETPSNNEANSPVYV